MLSFRLFVTSAVVSLLAIASAFAEAPARVRGTITAIDEGSMTVKARDGRIFMLKTGPDTMYACVVPSNLDEIKVNDFVGSAVKGPSTAMVAVELAIVPENMRAGRISLYGWDPLPDPTATKMTNGLVSNVSPAAPTLTNTNMTNGVVSAEKGDVAGRALTVTYDGGSKSFQITVPPNAPIVRYVLVDRSAVTIGSAVMIKTDPGDKAGLVTIGKGVIPPM
jgi:hypothetical protein